MREFFDYFLNFVDNLFYKFVSTFVSISKIKERMLEEETRSPFEKNGYWWNVSMLMSSRTSGLLGHVSIMLVVAGYFILNDQTVGKVLYVLGALDALFYVFIVGVSLHGLAPVAMDKNLDDDASYNDELASRYAYKMAVLQVSIRLAILGTFLFLILLALKMLS
ncbi:hypothetical protein DYI23_05715 [Roseibium polysiphoniae]|uniref:Uncharacterized protein n=1 Tax=Roseibium polysiphoniae TaxID=2571221 RepID=A0A944CAJ3_9HYPH|nr:hypothetical protein [Roseibium polysiphoniae]MBS8259710.1 hypothetical protein [Roseibium polysiphoniae]